MDNYASNFIIKNNGSNNDDISFYINRIHQIEIECNNLEIEHNNKILDLETSYSSKIVELKNEYKDYVIKKTNEFDSLKSKEEMRKNQITNLESNVIKNKNLIKDLKEQDNKKTKEILNLKEENSILKQENNSLKEEISSLKKETSLKEESCNESTQSHDLFNNKINAIECKLTKYDKIMDKLEKKEIESLVRLTGLSLFFLEKILYPKISTCKGQKVTWNQFRLSFTTREDYKTTAIKEYGVCLEKLKELIDERNELVIQQKTDIKRSLQEMTLLSYLLPTKYIELYHQIIEASNNYIYK
ncbi:hypothetical protein ACTFIW_009876 [Dictyostelium discoideum]